MLIFKVKMTDDGKVRLPQIRRSHIENLNEIRSHHKIGSFINSNLGEAFISRYVHRVLNTPRVIDVNSPPKNIEILERGFMVTLRLLDKPA